MKNHIYTYTQKKPVEQTEVWLGSNTRHHWHPKAQMMETPQNGEGRGEQCHGYEKMGINIRFPFHMSRIATTVTGMYAHCSTYKTHKEKEIMEEIIEQMCISTTTTDRRNLKIQFN